MGGCRCSYRNCTLRTDGKTHMFHYPVFDKVRCHQWLTNAQKLEFLNLKVSQLKNRVVCQHHFKDECFMNFKKEKLTFEAVPTEDGPYCNSNQDVKKTEQDETKTFSISLDDIENEYLTFVDKKANFSVKYGDFLTNCDLMDLDSLNQVNDNNQIATKNCSVLDTIPNYNVLKQTDCHNAPVKIQAFNSTKGKSIVNSYNLKNTNKNKKSHNNPVIINSVQDFNEQSVINQNDFQQPRNVIINVSLVPIEYDEVKPLEQNQQAFSIEKNQELKSFQQDQLIIPLEDSQQIKPFEQNQQAIPFQQNQQVIPYHQNQKNIQVSHNVKECNESKSLNTNSLKEKKKIRIISEKKISEAVPITGKFEPVSPNLVLVFPNKKPISKTKPIQGNCEVTTDSTKEVPVLVEDKNIASNHSTIEIPSQKIDTFTDNICVQKAEKKKVEITTSVKKKYSPQKNLNGPLKKSKTQIPEMSNKVLPKTCSELLNNSLLIKNKIPPERMAAIAEKRKFNMKLRDIIEDCLDKLDEPVKADYEQRSSDETRILPNKKQQQDNSYLAKDPKLHDVQDYTIAYLEARMKKMENNLLNKISDNSQKISELKHTFAPSNVKKTVSTQTLVSEEVHKKQLYKEISMYLSEKANSLIYEELFINKYTQDLTSSSPSKKRRKRR